MQHFEEHICVVLIELGSCVTDCLAVLRSDLNALRFPVGTQLRAKRLPFAALNAGEKG